MSVEFNHTIIPAKDKWVSGKFLAAILNLEAGPEWGDAEFDAALARIRAQGVRYYADPRRAKPGEINYLHGGRGVYFDDPNSHLMEIITHPYGNPPEQI
jgi:catechol 2,3-dioxygenase-like lactoylglutathione lyase family enzyme